MRFSFIRPDDRRWSDFLTRSEYDVYHLPGYARLLGREREMMPCACHGRSADAEFLLPLLLADLPTEFGLPTGMCDGRSPDGYPGPLYTGEPSSIKEALQSLMSFLRRERVIACFVRMHPLVGPKAHLFENVGAVVDRGRTIQITLDASYEDLLSRMRQGHRYEIRKAYEAGYRIEIDRWDLFPSFISFYRRLMERVDAAEQYRFSDRYFEEFRESLPGLAHLTAVLSADGTTAAAALFTLASGIIQYHLAAADPEFDGEAVQKLLVDSLVRFGLEHGARTVHLGGGVGARADSLLHFKAGFSRNALSYHTLHLVPDPEAYEQAEQSRNNLDAGRTASDFFPAYRAPLGSTD